MSAADRTIRFFVVLKVGFSVNYNAAFSVSVHRSAALEVLRLTLHSVITMHHLASVCYGKPATVLMPLAK